MSVRILAENYHPLNNVPEILYYWCWKKEEADQVMANGLQLDEFGYITLSTKPINEGRGYTFQVKVPSLHYLYDYRDYWYNDNEEPVDFDHAYGWSEENPTYLYVKPIAKENVELISSPIVKESSSKEDEAIVSVIDHFKKFDDYANRLAVLMKNLGPLRAQITNFVENANKLRTANAVDFSRYKFEMRWALTQLEGELESISTYISNLQELKQDCDSLISDGWSIARK